MGPGPLEVHYLARSDHSFNFSGLENIEYGHCFEGVFSENTLYTFSRFQKFNTILYICIFGVRFRSRNPCFRTPTIRYLSFGRGVTP